MVTKPVGTLPTVFIASPYTRGDVAMNTHFHCKIFDQLLTDGKCLPVAPLWSHFQHTVFPRPYDDWIKYDQAMLHLYDCCLRLEASFPTLDYSMNESSGADAEVQTFLDMRKPVFYSIHKLYEWIDNR
ncbi:MAG: hypothetical protein WDZ86_03500 [Gammaproteobacteria bacterium]